MSFGQVEISFSVNLIDGSKYAPRDGWDNRRVDQEEFLEIIKKYPFTTTVFKGKEFYDNEKGNSIGKGIRENNNADRLITDFIAYDLKINDKNRNKVLAVKNNLSQKNIKHLLVEGEEITRIFIFLQWSKNETFANGIHVAAENFIELSHKRDREARGKTRREDYYMMGETIAESLNIENLTDISFLKDLSIVFMPIKAPLRVIENLKGEPFEIANILKTLKEKRDKKTKEASEAKSITYQKRNKSSNSQYKPVEVDDDTRELFKNRVILSVPYREKEFASSYGAIWDNKYRIWYAPEEANIADLKEWTIDNQKIILEKEKESLVASGEYTMEIHEVLQDYGLVLEADASGHPMVDYDGGIVRVGVDGKKGKSGWYRVNPHTMVVTYGDWSRGDEGETFNIDFSNSPKGQEYGERSKSYRVASGFLAKLNGETVDARMEEEHKKNADRINEEFTHSKFAYDEHPYLLKKGVRNHYLRIDKMGNLLIPMRDIDGKLWSVQRIRKDGSKQFGTIRTKEEKANGISPKTRKKGTFALVGSKNIESTRGDYLVIAEGYATAATIFEATNIPTVVAFDAGNLMDVAIAIKKKFPGKKIIFAADNDIKNNIWVQEDRAVENVGIEKAIAAAKKTDGLVVVPRIPRSNIEEKPSDWNDIYKIDRCYARIRDAFSQAQMEGYGEKNYVFLSSTNGLDGEKGKKLFEFISQMKGVIVDAFKKEIRGIDKEAKAEKKYATNDFFIIAYALSKKQYEDILDFENKLLCRDTRIESGNKNAVYYLGSYMDILRDANITDVETAKTTFMRNTNIKEFSFSKDASMLTIVDNDNNEYNFPYNKEVANSLKKAIKSFIGRVNENLSTIKRPK